MSDTLHAQVTNLMQNFTLEIVPGSAAKIDKFSDHVRTGTDVYVTFLPGQDFKDTVACCKRLSDEGFVPIPHFAARSISSAAELEENLKAVTGETGTTRALTIAGGVTNPLGDFSDSMQLLDTGLFDKYGIKQIGVAGHPEGSPDMSDEAIWAAVNWKNEFDARSDASVYIVTQFAFEVEPIAAWDRALTAAGNKLPVHIGVPGIATLKTLIKLAQVSGVGPSMRFLTRQARNVTKLLVPQQPDKQMLGLAQHRLDYPETNIQGIHMYPLGGLKRTAEYGYVVADGKFIIEKDKIKPEVAF